MSNRGFAALYRKGKLRGDLDPATEPNRSASTVNAGHHGSYLAMHSKAPPPVAEYESWLASVLSDDPRVKVKLDGTKLRRIVIMRRNGESWASIGRVVGMNGGVVRNWAARLPDSLAV